MGASGWTYIIPYQEDVETALQTLRQEVFAAGDFNNYGQREIDRILTMDEREYADYIDEERMIHNYTIPFEPKAERLARLHQAITTIDGLLRIDRWGDDTQSILDIRHTSTNAEEYNVLIPLPKEDYQEIFGTPCPTRDRLEQVIADHYAQKKVVGRRNWRELFHGRYYWCQRGLYIILYKNTAPEQIYIEGCSGD